MWTCTCSTHLLWRKMSMERLVVEGLAKSIGVSNFGVADLQQFLDIARLKPVVNQIEFSAFLQNQTPGIVEFSQQNNVLVDTYSSLGPVTKSEPGTLHGYLKELANTHQKTPEQVLLRWCYNVGSCP
ncbi:hypothetical protein JCM33374_g5520 [Metschnikowia sp. JCM 33374]|nr:hypothetical protein JCM33374_g5520 [Metschnikowia sp. JCM 33374]